MAAPWFGASAPSEEHSAMDDDGILLQDDAVATRQQPGVRHNSSTPADDQKSKDVYTHIFSSNEPDSDDITKSAEQMIRDRAAGLFANLDVSGDGTISQGDFAAVNSALTNVRPIMKHLVGQERRDTWIAGLTEKERKAFEELPEGHQERPHPLIGTSEDRFVETWTEMHAKLKAQLGNAHLEEFADLV